MILNGVSSPLPLDAQGGFAVPVSLAGGLNGIAVSAVDTAGNKTETAIQVTLLLPPEITFSSNPTSVVAGNSATLAWTSRYADAIVIDPGIGEVPINGTFTVTPSVTTTYTMTATGAGGSSTASATVTVIAPPPAVSLEASQQTVIVGEPVELSWTTSHADTCTIDPAPV